MKKNPLFPLLLLVLAACNHDEGSTPGSQADGSIRFASYVVSTTTRSGQTGQQDDARLQLTEKGFGIFAFYTDEDEYPAENATLAPNFMYNQHVTYNSASTNVTKWEYSPLKYWPNGFSQTGVDDQTPPATSSADGGRLSFFAYAPWVDAVDDNTYGITGITDNNAKSDPKVDYKVGSTPDKCVDLLWGVVNTGAAASTIAATSSLTEGRPWLNMTKQTTTGKIDILFRHALAQINLLTYLEIDNILDFYGWEKEVDKQWQKSTKFTIESVTITADPGIYASGTLNLNNNVKDTPRWEKYTTGTATLTVSDDNIAPALHDNVSTSVTVEDMMDNATITGVTAMADLGASGFVTPTDAHYLIANSGQYPAEDGYTDAHRRQSFMIIPNQTPTPSTYTITVTYYVTTKDSKLQGSDTPGYSRIKNVISKTFQLKDDDGKLTDFQAGVKYFLSLGLGMTTVKFSVYGTNWDNADSPLVPLPANIISEHGTSADRSLAPCRR